MEQVIDIHVSSSKLVHLYLRHITHGTFTLLTQLFDLKGGSVKKRSYYSVAAEIRRHHICDVAVEEMKT